MAEVCPLLLAVLVLGSESVGVLRHVLRLLHQLRRLHALNGNDVEGVEILEGKIDAQLLLEFNFSFFAAFTGSSTNLLLGRVVYCRQGDETGDVLGVFLQNHMIPAKQQKGTARCW